MFIINIVYKKDFNVIENYLSAHRQFLDQLFQRGHLLMSGPKEPRTGGIIIALGSDQKALEEMFADDPYVKHDLADYHYIKFNPVKYRDELLSLVS
jgi:uncharacterized protein YciI